MTKPLAVTVRTAAEMLETSPRTIFRLLAEGRLKKVRVRSGTRVLVSSIEAYATKGGSL